MRPSKTFLPALAALLLSPAGWLRAEGLEGIIASGAKVEQVATGFKFTEGPAWSPKGFLLFSDIPASRIVRLGKDGRTVDFLQPSGKANGLMFDAAGTLFACQGGDRQVVRIDEKTKTVRALAKDFESGKFNSPNDLALDGVGGVYFTDPRYGQGSGPVEQSVMGVYYVSARGDVSRIVDDLERPNGILVSIDGKSLYVAEPDRRQLYRYKIDAPGKISDKTLIFTGDEAKDGGGPDGMTLDASGRIYATYRNVVVLESTGKLLGRIEVPETTSNCTFGGPGYDVLYITARKSLYSIQTQTLGMGQRLSGLDLRVPSTWTYAAPSSRMRLAQFDVPGADARSAAELVIYYFGPRGAGGVRPNIERWIGQFGAEGRKSEIFRGKGAAGDITLVKVLGTYQKSVGPPVLRKIEAAPGSAMFAAVVPSPYGAHFLKLTGPEKTVLAQKSNFLMLLGIQRKMEAASLDDL